MRFKDKVVVVTGGANGIGEAIGVAFLTEGAMVASVDIAVLRFREHERIFLFPGDVSKSEDCKDAVGRVVTSWGCPEILINCAAIQPLESYRPVAELSEEVWDRIMAVNLRGYFLMAKYCLPHMMRQGHGVIINIASVTAHAASKNIAAYAASKAGIVSLTRSFALEYAQDGIRAVAICPGTIDTDRLRSTLTAQTHGRPPEEALAKLGAAHPLGRIGTPSEVASVVLYVASDDASFITGTSIYVDGGLLAKGAWAVE